MSLMMGCCKAKLKVVVGVLVFLCATASSMSSLTGASENEAALQPEFSIHITPKTHVIINNTFSDGASLTVHCKSGDDDLGEQVVAPNGSYEFVFHPSVFFSTLFYCRLSSPHGWLEFDAYRQTRDWTRCYKLCMWSAAEDFVVGYDVLAFPDIAYNWNH